MLNRNRFPDVSELINQFCAITKDYPDSVDWSSWSQMFGSTAGGPHEGIIVGQAFTQFQIIGLKSSRTGVTLMWCDGVWRHWHGDLGARWDRDVNDLERAKKGLRNLEVKDGVIYINGHSVFDYEDTIDD